MPNVKREGGVLKPIPPREKMYIAFNMSANPNADPNGLDFPFKDHCFKGMSSSEDMLRQSLRNEVITDPDQVYAIFEIVRLIKVEPSTDINIVDRNMR